MNQLITGVLVFLFAHTMGTQYDRPLLVPNTVCKAQQAARYYVLADDFR